MILFRCILTLFLSTTCFSSSYEPSSGGLLFFSKAKYTICNANVIATYEISYNVYKKFEVILISLYSSIKINLVEVKYYYM